MKIQSLGQTGFRFEYRDTVIFVDPYLSDSVRKREGEHLQRLRPVPMDPAHINDANFVLVTHEHLDHCDPDTLVPIAAASPHCVFIAPRPAAEEMEAFGIARERIREAVVGPEMTVGSGTVHVVPAAHPALETDANGQYCRVGYVLDLGGTRYYHAGDTGVHEKIVAALQALGSIDTGLIPVNEQNFYRYREGIIGNMSVREAFLFAEEIGVETLVPTHWDMFAANQVFREEIELLYTLLAPPFKLSFDLQDARSGDAS